MKNKIFYFVQILFLGLVFCLTTIPASAQVPKVESWGFNTYGQLGNLNNSDSNLPIETFTDYKDVVSIQGGGLHTLALRANGTVLGVGYNPYGQLGNGVNSITGCYCELDPVQVKNPNNSGVLSNITAISAGGVHSLALSADGKVYAWGNNFNGELGNGSNSASNLPVQVGENLEGFDGQVIAIDAGFLHNLALTSDGRVWAWGFNNFRQLGDGTLTSQNTPKPVLTGQNAAQMSEIIQISAGAFHSVALKNDGTVWIWGSNTNKQIGNNDFTGIFAAFPVQSNQNVSGNFVRVAAGAYHNLALKNDGTVWVWGRNFEAELGNGTATVLPVNEPTQNTELSTVIEIKSDNGYHNLVRTRNGKVFAWGNNFEGEIGNGTFLNFQTTPFEITALGNFKTIIGAGVYNSYASTPQIFTSENNQRIYGENFTVNFATVNSPGETTILPFDPSSLNSGMPANFEIQENQPAYNFSTTAELSGDLTVCLQTPNEFNEERFENLRILQIEENELVDKTISSDYQRQQICAETSSLSTFVIAARMNSTTNFTVSGRVLTLRGRGIPYASVVMQDSQGNTRKTNTDLEGFYSFENVAGSNTYTFSASYRFFTFNPQIVTVNQNITDLNFVAQ